MPLACLTAIAGGVSCGPTIRVGLVVSALHTALGQFARCFTVPGSWLLGIATAGFADAPTGISRFAPRYRWLAVVESGSGLATGPAKAGQPRVAVGRNTAVSSARRVPGQGYLCAAGFAGGGSAPTPAGSTQVQPA